MLIADDMGLGKSLQAIGFANERRIKSILIICPSIVSINWVNEIKKFHLCKDLKVQVLRHRIEKWDEKADVIICSYALFDPLKCLEKTLLIVDESHYLKSSKSARTKAILNKKVLAKFKFHLFLSGTPVLNRPMEAYTIIKAIAHDAINFCDKHNFGLRFCNARRDAFGRWDYSGHSNVKELNEILRSIMIRRLKADVLHDLPDKIINIVQFEMDATTENIDAKIQPFKEEIVRKAQHGAGLDGIANHRRLIAEKKAPMCAEYASMVLNSVGQIVIFTYHREVAKIMAQLLKQFGVSVVVGGLNANAKAQEVEKFTSGKNRVFIGNIAASGVGINLVNAHKVIFAEADWVMGINKQAWDRCLRIGQKNFVNIDFLVYKDSVDEYILKSNFRKEKIVSGILA